MGSMVLYFMQIDYLTLPGWMTSIEDVRDFEKLPENAKNFIRKLEELVEVPSKLNLFFLFIWF